jgi:hypothetical protein
MASSHKGDIADLDEQTRAKDEKPRIRKAISEIFTYDGW